jgi:hypothetical protein
VILAMLAFGPYARADTFQVTSGTIELRRTHVVPQRVAQTIGLLLISLQGTLAGFKQHRKHRDRDSYVKLSRSE